MRILEALRGPRVRKAAIVTGALLALWAALGFLVLPPLLRPVVERKLAEKLHRRVTLRGLSINPFALSATLRGLDVKDRDGGAFFSLERLYVNAEVSSVFRGGPVLRAITVVKPSLSLVRKSDGTYNVQDLVDEPSKAGPKDTKPLRFSLNNIRVEGGRIDFDDLPKMTKHEVRDLVIGIPFLSNIPSKVEITTQPVLEARVNGSPFALHGKTKPFSKTHETTLDLDLSDIDLPFYLAYVPADTPSKLTSARLDAKLAFSFTQPRAGNPALVVSGAGALRKVAVAFDDRPLLAWDRLEAVLDSVDVFGNKARIRSLKLVAPELWIRRETAGDHNIAMALAVPAARKAAREAAAPDPAKIGGASFAVDVAETGIEGGKVHYDDLTFRPAFHAVLSEVAVSVKGFSTAPGKSAAFEASAKSDAGEAFHNSGTVSIAPATLEGTFSAEGVPLKRYTAFLEALMPVAIDDGVLALKTRYRWAAGPDAGTALSGLSVDVKRPSLRKSGDRDPFFRAASVAVADASLDLTKRWFVLGSLESAAGFLAVIREKDGNADLMALVPKPDPAAPAPPPSVPWDVTLKRIALHEYTVKLDDRGLSRPARYALTKTDLVLQNLSTAKGSKGTLAVRFAVDGKGVAFARGPVGFKPMFADLRVDVKGVDLVPIQAYVLQELRLDLARGSVGAAGSLVIQEDAAGKASVVYTGNALVANLLAVDESTKLDFLRWESFSASGMKAGYNPLFLEVQKLAAVGLACDVVIEEDGTMNLRKIVGAPTPKDDGEDAAAGSGEANPAPVPTAAPTPVSTPLTADAGPATVPGERDARTAMPIRIDEITLQGGRIGLADHFVKPNYSATLGDLGGRVTGLSSEGGTVASLDLRGNLANHSPLQVSGTINPLAAATFADVKATFRDFDLPSFTPYSGKYAGYAIAGGSLTMEVAYKVENRKLKASNRFLVNQFNFGEKVESKDATKLPVRLAVSLLKDKDGVIDLDLPIEGSLDDPKFRIGKVIWQILGNLIAKAVTSPFALLGKILGGKGEEYASVDFPDGVATLDENAKKKLDALAKALKDRPALTLQATGRVSGEKDLEGLRSLRVERKIRAQKLSDLARRGGAPASVDDVIMEAAERETYLKKAYKREKFPKPRTTLGFAKDLPSGEMEKLLLANETVNEDDLRQLALARSNAVKDYLAGPGALDPGRLFVLEPGSQAPAPKEKARASRVDFALK